MTLQRRTVVLLKGSSQCHFIVEDMKVNYLNILCASFKSWCRMSGVLKQESKQSP